MQKVLLDYTSPRATRALRRIIDDLRPDVVHVHNVYGIGSRLVSVASARTPTVVTLHDYWPIDVVAPAYRDGHLVYPWRAGMLAPWTLVHRRWHRRQLVGAEVVAPSAFLAERVGRVLKRPIETIPNGLDLAVERTRGEPGVLFVGRLVREKGLHGVLPSIVQVAGRSGWRVDVLGDGPLKEELQARFPTVRWHGSTDPAPFYRAASVLVVPSIWPENAPYVIAEAMAHGLTVIAAASGGIPEQIEDGATGVLYRPGDVASFGAALERVIASRELREALGARAAASVTRLAWPQVAAQYVDIYEQVRAERGAGQATVRTDAIRMEGSRA